MGLNDSLLQRQAAEGDAVARRIARMIEKPAVFLSTVRAGNTLCEMLGLACLSPVATRLFIARVYAGAATPDWAYPAFLLVVTLPHRRAEPSPSGISSPGRIGDFFPEGAALAAVRSDAALLAAAAPAGVADAGAGRAWAAAAGAEPG